MQTGNSTTLPDIRYTYNLNAPVEKVWRAVATPEGLSSWLTPTSDFQPVPGHQFTFRSEPHGDFDGIIHSKVLELDPPHHLAISWDYTNFPTGQVVTFDLKEAGNRTEFTLVHSGWAAGLEPVYAATVGVWSNVAENVRKIESFLGV